MKTRMTALELILHLAEGSTTPNTLQHITKIAREALAEQPAQQEPVDTPDSGNVIHERELLRALAWADYLRTHAERMYAAAVIPETTGAQTLLTKIKAGKLCDGDGVLLEAFTPRLVAVKHWAGLGTPDAVRKAADLLADYGWLARDVVPTGTAGGRPSDRYLIHPMLLKGGA